MNDESGPTTPLGWIGTGRMGYNLATRLLEAGQDLAVYNRTRDKAEPLAELGATIADTPADLCDREIVFTMVGGPDDFKKVTLGPEGVLSGKDRPSVVVDSTTISIRAAEEVRVEAEKLGVDLLAAPVSGNPKVVAAGLLTFVVSGPKDAYDRVLPFLEMLGSGITYVGEGERARVAKICHNLLLGVVTQSLAEILVLGEKAGISRAALMGFINDSVMGSVFTRYKTPALVKLDYTPTFTPTLLRKDFDLGFELAAELGVPMPLHDVARDAVQEVMDAGFAEHDFATLLEAAAKAASHDLQAEDVEVSDGLSEPEPVRSSEAQSG